MAEASDSNSDSSQHETATAATGSSDNNAGGRIYDNNSNSNSSGSAARNPLRSHFLYADYTPLEDDRNLIEMLKAFVSLTAQVIRRRETDARCVSLLDDSELLRKELASAIRNTRATATGALDRFYERNSGIFASVAGLQSTSSNAFLTDAKTSLDRMLVDVEANSTQQQEKHKENIRSIINANRMAAIDAMQVWLSDERRNFPRPVLESLSYELAAHIDPAANNDSYKVIRTASAAVTTTTTAATIASSKKEGGKGAGEQKDKVSEKAASPPSSRFTYISQFNTAGVEFWNYRKKVIDFGIEELMLPTGMKLPMSEKVKSTFRLSSRKEEESAKEPHFAKVDDFYVSSVVLRGEKTLEVLLASDVAATVAGPTGGEEVEGRGELFTVVFDAARLLRDSASVAAAHPIIRYMDNKEQAVMAETNLLQIKEIEQATNLRKLAMFGAAILSKLQILQNPNLLALKGKLELLTVEEKEAIAVPRRSVLGTTGNAREGGGAAGRPSATNATIATIATTASLVFVEFPLLFNLLEALAKSFGPVVERLREKTPVREELILRQELDRGQRKEFAVRVDDLRSQLGETPFGRSVSRAVFGA